MLADAQNRMQLAIDHLRSELAQIRTGRATPALVEKVVVEVYQGSQKLTIEELGQITVSDVQHLTIAPWDKSIIDEIAQGIGKANLGLTPIVDNDLIRLTIPALTEERRQEFIKLMQQKIEKYRVEIRQIRQDMISQLRAKKESGEMSEDEMSHLQKELQEAVDLAIEEIEVVGKNKEQDILQI